MIGIRLESKARDRAGVLVAETARLRRAVDGRNGVGALDRTIRGAQLAEGAVGAGGEVRAKALRESEQTTVAAKRDVVVFFVLGAVISGIWQILLNCPSRRTGRRVLDRVIDIGDVRLDLAGKRIDRHEIRRRVDIQRQVGQ